MLNPSDRRGKTSDLMFLWKDVRYLIVDEVSIGAKFLSQVSARMKQGKGDDPSMSGKSFGGVNVIFMGDFGQLKPPRQKSLYSPDLISSSSFKDGSEEDSISAMNGILLWRQISVVVKLRDNQRHESNPEYAAILDRSRAGKAARAGKTKMLSDCQILRQRELANVARDAPETLLAFADAPVIVGTKEYRDALNTQYLLAHAKALGRNVHIYYFA
ncbi:hypothetical protein HGRIS_004313 [Hohenbuehelia grisea]|uniref:ATP-dependent DNA helicase n=1 Tax=Hohenbuehelia grisea TaxID=104357 RepID=A0ABR3IPH4_9AGAR